MAKAIHQQYSPGVHKLIQHLGHLDAMVRGEIVAPIHVSVWPTILCQFKCSYCCCRNIPQKNGELGIKEFKSAVDVLAKYGTKALEFSGGGEPLLWKHFNEAVEYVHARGIKLSLITNGVALPTIPKKTLSRFSWIRVSLQSLAHAKSINFKHIPAGTRFSASYIVPSQKELERIHQLAVFAKETGLIIRVAVQRPSTRAWEKAVEAEVTAHGEPLFFSKKKPGAPLGCYMAWIRAAIDWRGNFLPCPSMQLNHESEGEIPEDFGLCHISGLEKWLTDNRPHDLGYRCKFCNCGKEHNDFVYNLFKGVDDAEFV